MFEKLHAEERNMNLIRRRFLGGAACFCGLLAFSGQLIAALKPGRPDGAFDAESFGKAMAALEADGAVEVPDKIKIKVPDIAENGAVVPVSISTSLTGVRRIALLVVDNPTPLNSVYEFHEGAVPYIATRVKMLKTSNVVALVEAGGKLYSARKEVKVTIGGCGG